jgi:hypothetical protein
VKKAEKKHDGISTRKDEMKGEDDKKEAKEEEEEGNRLLDA